MTVAPHFQFLNGSLHAERVPLADLAREYGTPLYVYSRQALHDAWEAYRTAARDRDVLVCYGMKANSNLAVLNEFKKLGSGFDIVSGGELARVLAIGGDPSRIVFSGVGKQAWEMKNALEAGVKCFNVESEAELLRLSQVAHAMGKVAPVSLRVNPDVDAQTHPYISTGLKENKFGIAIETALAVYQRAAALPGLEIVGVDCHIGSQITEVSPYIDALGKLIALIEELAGAGIHLKHLDLGGGIGIRYTDETLLSPTTLLDKVFQELDRHGLGHLQIVLEPGRSLVGNAGVLLTTVEYLKHSEAKNFAIVDAAMNDLIRPTLYEAYHDIWPVREAKLNLERQVQDVVGPVCETGDYLALDRALPPLEPGDLIAVMTAGAYGAVMSSTYNSRLLVPEVLVRGDRYAVVRPRPTYDDLIGLDKIPDWLT